jgi:ADP-dependent NAD(P)H-hydrate dehydratase / NAD(P)H-hydrate epimerase
VAIRELPRALYRTEQIRLLEKRAIDDWGLPATLLMDRAGMGAFNILCALWPSIKKIIVFCGTGNNAGDGYVLARLLHQAGFNVKIIYLGEQGTLPPAAFAAMQGCRDAEVLMQSLSQIATEFKDNEQYLPLRLEQDTELFVDALLGTGLTREVTNLFFSVIQWLNQQTVPVFALDIPSGLDANTGTVLGIAVRATVTATFIGVKQGLLTGQAPDYCGKIICDDLDLPLSLFKTLKPAAIRMAGVTYDTTETLRQGPAGAERRRIIKWDGPPTNIIEVAESSVTPAIVLKTRVRVAHKGDFGRVLIIGGNEGMPGAVRLAAEAALRSGAGSVTVATRAAHINAVSAGRPELLCYGVSSGEVLLPLLAQATVVIIGPGLGQDEWAKSLLAATVTATIPLLVDADGLNLLATQNLKKQSWVLTPHPGEAGRLLSIATSEVQRDRFSAVTLLQQRYGGICVLKGAGSLVCDAAGSIDLCDAGNPGMASAGMGDVLSGIIGGLLAQGLSLRDAATTGVSIHACAGNRAAANGERGLLATDLFPYIRELVNMGKITHG